MAQPTKGEKGYQTPTEQYPGQENQQSSTEIVQGAKQEDQLDALNKNTPESGRAEAKQAGSPPVSDEEINNGK